MTDSVVRNELGSSDDNNERAVSPSSSSSTSSSTNGNNGNGHRENVSNGNGTNGTNGGSAGNGTASKSRGRGKKEACPPTLINHWRLKPANLVEITFVDPQDLYSKKKGSGAAGSRRNSSPSASSTSSGSSGSDNSPSTSSTSSSNSNSSSSSSSSNSSSSSTPSPTSSNPTSPSEPQHNGAPSPLSLSAPQNGNGNGNGTGDSSSADSSKPKPPTPKNSRASYPPTQNHKFVSMQLPAGASELSGIPASVAPTPKPPHMFHDMRSTPMTSFPGIYPTPSLPYPSPVGLPPAYHFSYSSASPNSLASASAFRPFSLPLDNDNRLHVHNVNGNGNGNGQIGNGKINSNGPSGPGNVKEGEDATKELRQIPWATTNGHGGCGDGNDGRNATRYQGEPEEVLFRDGMLFRGANQIPFPFHPPFSNAHLPASLSSRLRGLPIPGQGNGDSNGITNGNDGKVVLPPIKQTLGTEMELRSPEESAPSTGSSGSSSPPSSSSSIPIPMSTTLPYPSASPSINEDAALLEHFRLNPTVHSNSTRPEHLNSASNRDRDNVSLKHSRSWSTDSNLKEQGDRKEGAREHAPPPAATSGNKSVEKITSSHKKMSIGNLVDSPRS